MADTKIEWSNTVWNPLRGCRRVSPGCQNCYAERMARRSDVPGGAYEGLTVLAHDGPRWNGTVRLVNEKLSEPLRWRKPRRVFVNSMSDLFHEDVPIEFIADVWAVMLITSLHESRGGHVYQILTKRPERMRDVLTNPKFGEMVYRSAGNRMEDGDGWFDAVANHIEKHGPTHPLIWLGVSVESPDYLKRIDDLVQCPAALHWVSAEPLLAGIDLAPYFWKECRDCRGAGLVGSDGAACNCAKYGRRVGYELRPDRPRWIVVGGESGPGARSSDVGWFRAIDRECNRAEVAFFMKQFGARPFDSSIVIEADMPLSALMPGADRSIEGTALTSNVLDLAHPKGGDMSEWPEDLRVREYPEARA